MLLRTNVAVGSEISAEHLNIVWTECTVLEF